MMWIIVVPIHRPSSLSSSVVNVVNALRALTRSSAVTVTTAIAVAAAAAATTPVEMVAIRGLWYDDGPEEDTHNNTCSWLNVCARVYNTFTYIVRAMYRSLYTHIGF